MALGLRTMAKHEMIKNRAVLKTASDHRTYKEVRENGFKVYKAGL